MAKDGLEIIQGKNIINNLINSPQAMHNIFGRVIDPPIKREMQAYRREFFGDYPGSAHSPAIFETDASRRAFFAKTQGQRYRRTGAYKREQVVETNRQALEAAIVNKHEAAQFLTGERQTRQHRATGYPVYKDHAPAVLARCTKVAEKALISEISRELFKRGSGAKVILG